MPTVADFQEEASQFVAAGNTQADVTKHDPNTFAGLTAQSALQNMYNQGLQPTGDDIKGVYTKALDDANMYHTHLAEEQERSQQEMKRRVVALTPGVVDGQSILGAEEQTRVQAELAKQKALEQWQQTSEIHRASDADIGRINGFEQGYQTADTLQKYHADMVQSGVGGGGVLKSAVLGAYGGLTSQPTRNFNAYLESAIVPLGRGVFGDAATAATKESIQANMREMLSNSTDNLVGAGNKTFMLKDRIMQNLITDRNNAEANHVDTTPWDKAIGRLSTDYTSKTTRQYAPAWAQGSANNPLVQSGTSTVATANMDNQLIQSAQANNPNRPTGYVGGTVNPAWSGGGGPVQQSNGQQQQQPNLVDQSNRYFGGP